MNQNNQNNKLQDYGFRKNPAYKNVNHSQMDISNFQVEYKSSNQYSHIDVVNREVEYKMSNFYSPYDELLTKNMGKMNIYE